MAILASSHPFKLSLDLSFDGFAASHEILRGRRDYDEKLGFAFDELIAISHAEESAAGSNNDSAIESGLYYSAKSSFHSDLAEAFLHLTHSARGTPTWGSEKDGEEDADKVAVVDWAGKSGKEFISESVRVASQGVSV